MAGYIGTKAVNLSTTGADINGDANVDGTLTATAIDGTTIGATTPAAGTFSTLEIGSNVVETQTDLLLNSNAVIGSASSINCVTETGGLFRWYGGVTSAGGGTAGGALLASLNSTSFDIDVPVDIAAGNIDGTVIGATTPAAGDFTTVGTTGAATVGAGLTVTNTLVVGGQIRADLGTEATPSISFNGDTDTGFYRTSANNIGVTTGGAFMAELRPTYIGVSADSAINSSPASTAGIYGCAIRTDGQYNSSVLDGAALNINRSGSTGTVAVFRQGNTNVGRIDVTATTTSYIETSDHRMKENVTPIQGAIELIRALNPVTYNWKADGTWMDGFLAHEVQTILPSAVVGELDGMQEEEYEVEPEVFEEVGADGKVIKAAKPAKTAKRIVPDMQGMNYSRLTPVLTAGLQAALDKIDELTAQNAAFETRLAALEAK